MRFPLLGAVAGLMATLLACGAGAPPTRPAGAPTPAPLAPPALTAVATPLPTAPPTATAISTATAKPAPEATAAPSPAPQPTATPTLLPGEVRLEVAAGSEAAYVAREQLARLSFPSDAVGITKGVKGSIVVGAGNTVRGGQSKITVDLRTLASDEDRRDRFIQQNTLETGRFPYAEFVLREVSGLASPLPTGGEAEFKVSGDLTVHGVTRPVTWDVSARFAGTEVTGRATTSFRFADFGMEVPRVFLVLSVEDSVRLRLDFQLSRSG